ncbi:MAG: M1 family aminopeptidase [Myxococcota bacterium]
MACFQHASVDTEPIPFAEPGVRANHPPDRAVRIDHAEVILSVDPAARSFRGTARLRLTPYPAYAGVVALDLDEVRVVEVIDGNGAAVPFRLEDGQLVALAEAAPEVLEIRWTGQDPRAGLYFTGPDAAAPDRPVSAWTQCQDDDGHFVFPCHDHPSVKHPWTLELEAPPGFTLLSNGERVAGGERDGRVWARFEQREPMPAYLVTFVAAPLAVIEAQWRGKPVRYLVPPGAEAEARRAFGRTPDMIEHFSTLTGVPYPWPRYDQVVVHEFVFGGMENVACTTMTDLVLVDEKAALEQEVEGLVAHELAHQWFGDLVTCEDWSQAWLNESWATVMEAVWWEQAHDPAAATWYRWVTAQDYHSEKESRYQRPIVCHTFRQPIDLFDRHLYNKGSCVLWTLRAELGSDAFWAGVGRYLTTHANDTVHTRHFQRALEKASGRNLEKYFQQWIYSPGHPELDVKLARDGEERITVTVEQKQSGDDVPEVFALTLRTELVYADGTTRTVDLRVDERSRTFVVPVDGPLVTVRVDPGYRVLARLQLHAPDAWLVALTRDVCPVLALRAVKALLRDGAASHLAAVEQALTDHPFWGLRAAVAGELGRRRRLAPLVAALAAEREPRVRRAIAGALGEFRDAAAADALLALLNEEIPTWHLEGAALLALGKTRDPRARAAIERRLADDAPPSWGHVVRQRALEGLAETRDPDVLATLVAHTRPDRVDRVRAAASGALGTLGDLVPDVRQACVEQLVEVARSGGFRTQLAAVAALARIRDAGAEPVLRQLQQGAPDGRTRRAAFEALARISRGRSAEAGVANLRGQLDALREEHARLRDRLDRLER